MRHILSLTAIAASLALAMSNAAQADHDGYYGGGSSYGYGTEQRYHDQLGHNAYHRNMDHSAYHDSLNHSAFDRQLGGYSYPSNSGYGGGYGGYGNSGYGGYGNYGGSRSYGPSGYSSYPRSYGGW